MMRKKTLASAVFFASVFMVVFVVSARAATPSINCRGARSPVDRLICASPETVALDQEITALYNRGMAKFSGDERHRLAQSQLAYLHRRSGCNWASHHSAHPGPAVGECVAGVMGERLHGLRAAVDRGS
jgi:uncharacterized protein